MSKPMTPAEIAHAHHLGLNHADYVEARDADPHYQIEGHYQIEFSVAHIGDPDREWATQIEVTRFHDRDACTLECGEFSDGRSVPRYVERAAEKRLDTLPHRFLY